jgi:hypothetical protein
MTAGHGDPARDELVDELEGAIELGRQRHLTDRAGVEQPPQQVEVGRPAPLRVMDAEALRRQEGPLEVRADHPRAAALDRHGAQRRREVGLGRGDEGRLEGGDAAGQQGFAGTSVGLSVSALEVDAGEAVDLQIDEARSGDPAMAAAPEAQPGYQAVVDGDVARQQPAVHQRGRDAEPHRRAASRTLPAAASRLRAAAASIRPESGVPRGGPATCSRARPSASAASSGPPIITHVVVSAPEHEITVSLARRRPGRSPPGNADAP